MVQKYVDTHVNLVDLAKLSNEDGNGKKEAKGAAPKRRSKNSSGDQQTASKKVKP